ncbi:hypothetical protein FIBSPDRAFT_193959 [Athelia psychrophila]|uniref:EF-hand domain-containing protein n=1 Tax=Athelia psychrophila TaxID=1759441 RepID=A0A166SJK6_9AGAM|nr:hypothetical protein FIBSPDRAFT_193959 [Fibularhizoctonia sp. CBS 109695]
MSRNANLAKDFAAVHIEPHIEQDQKRITVKLANLVGAGQDKLTTAKGIVDNAAGVEVAKIGKEALSSLLAPAKDIIAILDIVAQIHPAVSVALAVIKVVVQLELDRQDNDRHIACLFYSMSDMLFVLSYLDPVFEDDDNLKDSLETLLKSITENIDAFGNLCDEYYKHKTFVRTIFSGRYKGKLDDFAQTFADTKDELKFLVLSKSAVTTMGMKSTLNQVSAKVDKVIAFLEKMSPEEKKAAEAVQQRGVAAVIEDEKFISSIASKLGQKINSDIRKDMKFTMRTDLDEALEMNRSLYDLKFDAAQLRIQHLIEHSTSTILLHMDAGPHDLIRDEDIRAVWKDMQWRVSCKVRHFVDAIHYHFAQKYLAHQKATGELHPDAWTLNYMSKVIFHPAIGNAIDEDGSGYLSVSEVDQFFQRKPQNWSAAEWIAYWGVGWYKNAIVYSNRCRSIIAELQESQSAILEPNKEYIAQYFGESNEGLDMMGTIVNSIYTNTLSYHTERNADDNDKLHLLRSEAMNHEIGAMKTQLAAPKYQLDDLNAVFAVCGTSQLELPILCLIYLILQRHKKIIDLSKKLVLSEEEFDAMDTALQSIGEAFDKRYRNLVEGWQQQRLNVDLQVKSFAAGLFEDWHLICIEDDAEDEDSESDAESDAKDEDGDADLDPDTELEAEGGR